MLRSHKGNEMPVDPWSKTSFPFRGPCAGGPKDGEIMSACVRTINIPIIISGQPGYGFAAYEFNEDIGMWIWTGSKNF